MAKKIFLAALIVLVLLQFIQPTKNQTTSLSNNDLSKMYEVPQDVRPILQKACYDCHSNNTKYPWYNKIQPVAWWLQYHVNDGKKHLNFSEFGGYEPKKQYHKLEEIAETVEEGEMPLNSYTWMHKEAQLTSTEKQTLLIWAQALRKTIALQYQLKTKEED